MADEEHGAALLGDVSHLAEALPLEIGIADREDLVDEEDLRLEMRGDGERESEVHPARVALDRSIDELFDLRKGDDLVEFPADLGPAHAEDRAVEVNVFASGELGMESRADFQERAHASVDLGGAVRRLRDPGQDLQQRALPRSVAADDSDHLALADFEVDVAQRPEQIVALIGTPTATQEPGRSTDQGGERVAQSLVALDAVTDPVLLGELPNADRHAALRHTPASTRER